jgi:hypothetical protein
MFCTKDSLMTLHAPWVLLRCIKNVWVRHGSPAVPRAAPWHFVRAPDGCIVHQDGTTALRDRLFQAAGYEVLSVRVEDKAPSDFQTPRFRRWLHSQLQGMGLACSTVHAQVWLA